MFAISKALTNLTFIGHVQQVRHWTQIEINHTYKLINACNSIDYHQRNEPVENWDRVKYRQINKHPDKSTVTNSY